MVLFDLRVKDDTNYEFSEIIFKLPGLIIKSSSSWSQLCQDYDCRWPSRSSLIKKSKMNNHEFPEEFKVDQMLNYQVDCLIKLIVEEDQLFWKKVKDDQPWIFWRYKTAPGARTEKKRDSTFCIFYTLLIWRTIFRRNKNSTNQ